ncbi:MAG: hypothetical protein HKL95_01885 [Phycisphaerae bacterium]|nr:hypothetical protein [Phycisphaerae bacterium]
MDHTKNATARRLADAHYAIEPGIQLIVELVASGEKESDPAEPVKLLEVNENTVESGIRPIFFGPHAASGIHHSSVIVEVTPAEFAQLKENPSLLPNGWKIGRELAKPAAGVHQ